MKRKWIALTAIMSSVAALAIGSAWAADEDSPLHKLMEDVNKKNLTITKGVRTAVAYKKAQKDVAESAKALAKLGKDARDMDDAVKKSKETLKKWQDLMDEYIKASETLAEVAGKDGSTNVQAKEAHGTVKKSCTACHDVFRVDEAEF